MWIFRALGIEHKAGRSTKFVKQKQSASKARIEPKSATPPVRRTNTKQAAMIKLLLQDKGTTIDELVQATGWQRHSVYGVLSGVLKKKLGLAIRSESGAHGRIYKITASI